MAGKRRKHKLKYKPKNTPKVLATDSPIELSEPLYSEPPLIVFVSSLIDKMQSERDAVTRAVRSIPITRDWRFENVPASSQFVDESYLSRVTTSDIFLLVLGPDYSPAVEREYETAVNAGRPILAFVNKGPKDAEQSALVSSIRKKYALFTGPDDLLRLVAGSIWDELIRAHRNSIAPNAAPHVIQQIPLPLSKLEDRVGYFIIGLDDTGLADLYKMLGATDVPENLETLYPHFEHVPVVNVVEINTVLNSIRTAHENSRAAQNQRAVFVRELKKQIVILASHHLKRQRTKIPESEVTIPGITYYLWGMEHDYARLVKLLRLEEFLKEPLKVERTDMEVCFQSAEHFIKLTSTIIEASHKAAGDLEELRRLLALEAVLSTIEDEDD